MVIPEKRLEDIILKMPPQRWKIVAMVVGRKSSNYAVNNTKKSHPFVSARNPLKRLHAEVRLCCITPDKVLEGCTVIVYRKNVFGRAMAKPCSICIEALRLKRVKKVIYSTTVGFEEMEV